MQGKYRRLEGNEERDRAMRRVTLTKIDPWGGKNQKEKGVKAMRC